MKKSLLTFMAAIGMAASANAQLALETFDVSGAAGTIPAGWAMQSDGHTVNPALFGGGLPAITAGLNANAWFPISGTSTGFGAASDYQMITTSDFSPATTADRWLMTPAFLVTSPYMVIQWDDNDLGSGESINVLASATASTVTGTYTSLYSAPAGNNSSALTTHQVAIGAYNGTSIRIAFRDHTDNNWGMLLDNVQSNIIDSLNLEVTSIGVPVFVQTSSSNPITGVLTNAGALTITSARLSYNVNGGAPVSTPLTGLSIPLGSTYNYTSGTPWVPSTAGAYTLKVWVDNLNGTGVDENPATDTLTALINVIDSLQPKIVMIEEFNQASCDPCADAAPNVDSVCINNASSISLVRYHVDWPGRDCMDSVTLGPFVQAMVTYYNVSGVPDAQMDGSYIYPGAGTGAGFLNTANIQAEAAQGSPFKITVAPSFDPIANVYSFTATVKCFASMPAGLVVRAALTIDTITYAANQSTESIPQTMFPQVAENMFPSASGSSLAAFTAGATQTVTSSWSKNHAWGSDRCVWGYDSSLTGKITVWVMDNTSQYVYQSASASLNTVLQCSAAPTSSLTTSGTSSVTATYTGSYADSVKFTWGDGSSSLANCHLNSTHVYTSSGTYTVCAVAYNTCGSNSACRTVTVVAENVGPVNISNIEVFPNPTHDELKITGVTTDVAYRLISVAGASIYQGKFEPGMNTLVLGTISNGVYILELKGADGERRMVRVVKE